MRKIDDVQSDIFAIGELLKIVGHAAIEGSADGIDAPRVGLVYLAERLEAAASEIGDIGRLTA